MTNVTRRELIEAGLGAASLAALSMIATGDGRAAPDPAKARTAEKGLGRISRINDIPTMFVDGAPFLIEGAQCDVWRSTRQDQKVIDFFDAYQRMNATAVGVDILWSKIEVAEGQYDFAFLDWFMKQAEQRGLKLVLQLFSSNVCGKIQEGSAESPYPVYVPDYIKNAPDKYQRMLLETADIYATAGPPMCPNDPRTVERERLYVIRLARYLKERDLRRTVILAQVNNEYGYWAWKGKGVDNTAVRCQCSYCTAKWNAGFAGTPYEFMITSFADHARTMSDAITAEYPLPLYLNSPLYWPATTRIFLDRCPNIAVMGMDGVDDPHEPNALAKGLVGRNIPFAAECPTEHPRTRFYLDALPYYTTIGEMGLGHLLWESGPPNTVVDDADASTRYGRALYPIKNAMRPIARFRGTSQLSGWYALKEFSTGKPKDVFVREGGQTRTLALEPHVFDVRIGDAIFSVVDGGAGIVIAPSPGELIIATPAAQLQLRGVTVKSAETGRFAGDTWTPKAPFAFTQEKGAAEFKIDEPSVIRLRV
ncbi:MAG: beta-galactosidase [Capsulimonadaceae bacterium]|nr:beta-galactosidase [Capsulimonadaceae bacterium]